MDPSLCPLCGESNGCGNLIGMPQGTCWCSSATFPPEIFKSIPDEKRRKACICKACVEKFG
ncbi:cysteine-rich CWC family protein [Cohnella herbarum]|uniref:Cysteine-rich CWC family protein n=1 Tax=Cohnella herbarum TaxID=2728023 RepID=A0A7Z2ZRL0_9BACL|nr:cysteine-rich CWC family protein [Cohnella herbarum]